MKFMVKSKVVGIFENHLIEVILMSTKIYSKQKESELERKNTLVKYL